MSTGQADWRASISNLLPDIKRIVRKSDLDSVSNQSVRRELKALYPDLDTKGNKAAIDVITEEVYCDWSLKMDGERSPSCSPTPSPSPPPPVPSAGNSRRRDEFYSPSPPPTIKKSIASMPSFKKKAPVEEGRRETDAEFMARVAQEMRDRGMGLPSSSASPRKTKKETWARPTGRDAQEGMEGERKKSTTGFNKPWILSTVLADLVGAEEMSRPQVTKHLWIYIKANGLQNPQNGNEIFGDEKFRKVFPYSMITSFQMAKKLGPHLFPVDSK